MKEITGEWLAEIGQKIQDNLKPWNKQKFLNELAKHINQYFNDDPELKKLRAFWEYSRATDKMQFEREYNPTVILVDDVCAEKVEVSDAD